MKKPFLYFLILAFFIPLAQGCTTKPRELKSPCVGASGSPCEKRNANSWLA